MIKIYSKPNCYKCTLLKEKLKEKNIPFEECEDYIKLMKNKIMSVPVLETEEGELITFDTALVNVERGIYERTTVSSRHSV